MESAGGDLQTVTAVVPLVPKSRLMPATSSRHDRRAREATRWTSATTKSSPGNVQQRIIIDKAVLHPEEAE